MWKWSTKIREYSSLAIINNRRACIWPQPRDAWNKRRRSFLSNLNFQRINNYWFNQYILRWSRGVWLSSEGFKRIINPLGKYNRQHTKNSQIQWIRILDRDIWNFYRWQSNFYWPLCSRHNLPVDLFEARRINYGFWKRKIRRECFNFTRPWGLGHRVASGGMRVHLTVHCFLLLQELPQEEDEKEPF